MLKFSRLAALGLVLFLIGCGNSGPSDAEIAHAAKDHLVKSLNNQQSLARFALGNAGAKAQLDKMTAEVQAMDVSVGTKARQQDGSYSVVVTFRDGSNSKVQTLKLVKATDGWVVPD